ncbi:putative ribonuclease H-like domain-containing protein [Tanacetum coccineum]
MTGNKAYLDEFQDFNGGPVAFGGSRGYITGKGKIKTGKLDFEDVCFVKELQHFNLFSVSQMCDKKNKVLFTDSECLVLSPEFKLPDENQVLLKIPRQNNMYSFNLENIVPTGGLACLIANATTDESNKWHRRLGHVNFKNLNKLVKGNLVRGLPSKIFQNDHTCVACQKGKQHKASCKAKAVSSISQTLQLLHMDLFGPTSENQLNQKVKTIRVINGTEFKNKEVIEFCGLKGIKREYSNARTPQQNGVAERKNRTLIEAARTMLADSFLPNTFWAEAVSTACYVLNRVLVTKPHNKTPYELLTGKIPIISYIRPFGCHVTILNTIDHLGKFAGKSDEGFLVGYSLQSKAFRVYNLETKRVEENLHITFLENKPNVAGKGPTWLFDLDYLTDSMNYHPVSSENQANLHAGQQEANQNAGTKEIIDVGDSDKEDDSAQDLLLIHSTHPRALILGDPNSAVQTRSKVNTSSGAHAFVSYVQKQKRTNHKDFHHCLFACFLSQHNPRRFRSSEDKSWLNAKHRRIVAVRDTKGLGLSRFALWEEGYRLLDDISLGHSKKSWCDEFEALMKSRFQMSSMGELTFFLSLQVKQKPDGIFISQDKYVAEILVKFDFANVKTASTPIETRKPLVKDEGPNDGMFIFMVHDCLFFKQNEQFLFLVIHDETVKTLSVLDSCPKHNMVAYLEKSEGNEEFHEIIDSLKRSSIHFALIVSPIVSTTFVEQFWTSAKSKTINNVRHITAKVAGKSVSISEASIRSDLRFDDADGIDTLPNQAIFDAIQQMGYEGDLTVLTFNKALFSPQWRFLFHTINHCLSSKSTSWDQIPTNIATAVICLTSNQKYNFSKLIFDGMLRHLDAKKKFVMYPRFISIFLGKQLVDVSVPLDHFPVNTLTSKVFSFMVKKGKHFSGKVTPLFASMLVQPTQDEGASSERPSEALPTPSPAPTSEVPYEPQTDSSPAQTSEVPIEHQPNPSPRPSPTTTIPAFIPETSGENLGGHSSSDKSLSGNEGDMTIQGVYDLCLSLCKQVSDQAKEIQALKAQITKLKKQAKPVIKHHKAYLKSVSLKQRFPRKSFSKKHRVHKESVSKQGRKFAKGESSVQRDPLFDEMPEDKIDHMETENAQSEGRTREMVDEDKEIDEARLSTEDEVSTVKEGVSTDFEKVSTDGSKVSTDRPIEGTEEQVKGTDELKEGTEEHNESTEEQREGTEEKVESTDGQIKGTEDQTEEEMATQTPTSKIFGDDETIAKVLLNMSQAKAVSREKEKGVELKDVEETDRPKPTSTRSLLTLKPLPKIDPKDKGKKKIEEEDESESESDGIPQAEKKFKQLESDEELARKMQEEWEAEEERNRIAEENAANEDLIRDFDDIKARIEADRLLAEKLQEQEREQFTIEERAKFLHDTIAAQRKFLAQQRSEAIRNKPPTKNQLRNQMMTYLKHVGNYKHAELKIKKFEEVQALYEKIKRSEMKDFHLYWVAEDEVQENDELRLYLTISQDEEKEVDYEILDRKYPIKEWKTECLGAKPQTDQAEHLEEINFLNCGD